ncbi:hypothetical protein HDU92_002064 [Lobulomyces angularis]|nr:hypothetical protein HDU92_002064 [Lobulomyces angularis]
MSRNNVRGPTSALSSFLKERGITSSTVNYRTSNPLRRINSTDPPADAVEASADGETTNAGPSTSTSEQTTENGTTENLVQIPVRVPNKKKKRQIDSDDDEAFEKPIGRSNYSKRLKQKFDGEGVRFCKKCNRRYFNEDVAIEKCDACCLITNSNGGVEVKPRKKKKKEVGLLVERKEYGVKSLKDLCLQVVADYIEDVEDFGSYLTNESKVKISKIISRNRSLNNRTFKLFIGPDEDEVELFDCTRLDESALINIAQFCPMLVNLKLKLCGRITDKVIFEYAKSFRHLTSFTLSGCYLVSDTAFQNFFEHLGKNLNNVNIEDAAKITKKSVQVLLDNQMPQHNLRKLVFKRCCYIGEDAMQLAVFKIQECGGGLGANARTTFKERKLKLRKNIHEDEAGSNEDDDLKDEEVNGDEAETEQEAEASVENSQKENDNLKKAQQRSITGDDQPSDDTIIKILEANGNTLTELSLEGFIFMEDKVLLEGILKFCPNLLKLSLARNENLTSEGLKTFFQEYQKPIGNLVELNLKKLLSVNDDTLNCIVNIHQRSLVRLNLYGVEELTGDSLKSLANLLKLKDLDLSWCRNIDDEMFKDICGGMNYLKIVKIFGCHLLSESLLDREWKNSEGFLKILGSEWE